MKKLIIFIGAVFALSIVSCGEKTSADAETAACTAEAIDSVVGADEYAADSVVLTADSVVLDTDSVAE